MNFFSSTETIGRSKKKEGEKLGKGVVAVIGVPFDGTSIYRSGSRFAPSAIRKAAKIFSPLTSSGKNLHELDIVDLGDLDLPQTDVKSAHEIVRNRVSEVLTRNAYPVLLGGDHSITIAVVKALAHFFKEEIGIIYLDAHLDLLEDWFMERNSHACVLRRILELEGILQENIAVIGYRSVSPQEKEFLENASIKLYSSYEIFEKGLKEFLLDLTGFLKGLKRVYVTVDVDVLDPAYAPGSGYPEPGGLTTRELLGILHAIGRKSRLQGMDIVEVCPPFDHSNITSLAAAKILLETMSYFKPIF